MVTLGVLREEFVSQQKSVRSEPVEV